MIDVKLGAVKDMGTVDDYSVLVLYIRTTDPEGVKCLSPGRILIKPKRGRGRPRKNK